MPWSEEELFDLANCLRLKQPIEKITELAAAQCLAGATAYNVAARKHHWGLWLRNSRSGN